MTTEPNDQETGPKCPYFLEKGAASVEGRPHPVNRSGPRVWFAE
jgi:hypothetical protein